MNIIENKDNWVGFEVITETGETLGWVSHSISGGEEEDFHISLIISILPSLWLPKAITGSYKLSAFEIVSSGPDRLITFEGAEDRIICLTVSWLERIGLVHPPWRQGNSEKWDLPPDDGGGPGMSPVPAPRNPGPHPLNAEAQASED